MNDPSPLEAIFFAALGKGSAQERAAFLDEACAADPSLRRHVERMLAAQGQAGSFLEEPASEVCAVVKPPITERPGSVIGSYHLLEQIGEGGFGVVFLAEQTGSVRRKVALKVLKPGMDTRQVVARFEAERQALAIMDHPNIAKVFDGGATPAGRPYFVMELVQGVPITDYCDENRLTAPQRLELFGTVCQAVQHAHQKGIIHRDLKPSNVLVSRHDAAPVVKVIDFGVAKAIGQDLTDKTLFTSVAQLVGTPLYMSPEQAGMGELDVDTRSDVYSLGVMLYELLTGTTPFDQDRLKGAGYEEIRRIIRQEEPARPSARLSSLGLSASAIASCRGSDPLKLSALLRGELDWIVMRALEKDRRRRYATANDLAADVQRYLADEPVQACPPSGWYRFRKFARRNKLALGASAIVLLLTAGAATALGIGYALVNREHREAERALAAETKALRKLQKTVERERRNYYSYAFELAQRDWLEGDTEHARRSLQDCPEEYRDLEWKRLYRLCHAEVCRIDLAHGATKLRYSPDGKYLVGNVPAAARIVVWDASSGKERATFATAGPIAEIGFGKDENELVWVTDESQPSPQAVLLGQRRTGPPGELDVTVWDLTEGRRAGGFRRKGTGGYASIDRAGARVILVENKPHARPLEAPESMTVYETHTGREVCVLAPPYVSLGFVAFDPDGHVMAFSPHERILRCWDAATGGMTRSLHCDPLSRLTLSPDGQRLAAVSAAGPGQVKVLDTQDFREIATFRAHAAGVTGLAFSADGRRLATVSGSDKAVRVWDANSGQELVSLRGHTGGIWDVAFSPNGSRLATCSSDIRIWDVSQSDDVRPVSDGPR